jgi:hypothetical protein
VGGGPGVPARWLAADGYRVHLVDPVERHVAQALRVVKPGGPVVAAGIQRFARVFDRVGHGRPHRDGLPERTARVVATGRNEGEHFTHAYFHDTGQLADEPRAAGLADVRVHGVEGPGDSALKAAEPAFGRRPAQATAA